MNQIQSLAALRAFALLNAFSATQGQPQQQFLAPPALFPEPESYAPPYLGNDFLGADSNALASLLGLDPSTIMGAEPLMGNELMGLEGLANMLGAEGMALLGRDPRFARRKQLPPVQAVPRQGYLPIPTTVLPAAAPTQIINIFPQAQGGIQLTRLIVPSNQGARFLINDVTVATRSQFFAPGSISAVMCSEVQTMHLRGDVAYPGTIVSISVTNTSGADQTLSGAAFLAEAREARAI